MRIIPHEKNFINKRGDLSAIKKEDTMAYVMDLNKMCKKCGKRRVVGVKEALEFQKMPKIQAERIYCTCS